MSPAQPRNRSCRPHTRDRHERSRRPANRIRASAASRAHPGHACSRLTLDLKERLDIYPYAHRRTAPIGLNQRGSRSAVPCITGKPGPV
jgi:hypothetical protein